MMMSRFLFPTIFSLVSFAFALPPNEALHHGLKEMVNPNGILLKPAPDVLIPIGKHGFMIPYSANPNWTHYRSKQDDFKVYPLGNTTIYCDPPQEETGTCYSDENLSVLVECTIDKNADGTTNWAFLFINDQGMTFSGFGQVVGFSIPKDFPPPPKVNGQYPNTPLPPFQDQYTTIQDSNIILQCPSTHYPSLSPS